MSKIDEVVEVENNNKRFPNIKRLIMSQHEQLRCDLIVVFTGTGVPCTCSAVKDTHANPGDKLCNGLWDPLIGIFRGCDAPTGSKRVHNKKLKVLKDLLPTLKEKIDANTKKKMDPLPSFIMAKIS